jgi:hypothetical protein
MKTPWLPAAHAAPLQLETPRVRLRPLQLTDGVRDYDAVMSSRAALYDSFGPGTDWPPADLSLEQNLVDLGWHQASRTAACCGALRAHAHACASAP